MAPGRIVHQMRHMVVNNEPVETDLLQFPQHRHNVAVAFAEEALRKVVRAALHVPQMYIEDAPARSEPLDSLQHARPTPHLRPAAMTEVEAMHRTGMRLHRTTEALKASENPRHAAKRGNGRIIRVQRHANTCLLA